jgi:hypothetical protein
MDQKKKKKDKILRTTVIRATQFPLGSKKHILFT